MIILSKFLHPCHLSLLSLLLPRKLTWQWKTNHESKCISYQKWWLSSHRHVVFFGGGCTLPETNIKSPLKWMVVLDLISSWVSAYFQVGTVSFREGIPRRSQGPPAIPRRPTLLSRLRYRMQKIRVDTTGSEKGSHVVTYINYIYCKFKSLYIYIHKKMKTCIYIYTYVYVYW